MTQFSSTFGTAGFKKWDLWSINDYMVCKLLDDSRVDKFGKPIYDVEVIETSLGVPAGAKFQLNATGGLTKKMNDNEVAIDDVFKVVYLGKNKIEKGTWKGTMAHNIDLQLPEGKITVANDQANDLI
jgi:hypothetical protein